MPTKEFILSLNNAKPPKEQFVIEDLDETRLFVQAKAAEWLEQQIAAWQEHNTYQVPPAVQVVYSPTFQLHQSTCPLSACPAHSTSATHSGFSLHAAAAAS